MEDNTKSLLAGIGLGVGIGGIGTLLLADVLNKLIPFNPVQAGYAAPSKLEIDTQDLDENGRNELILRYDGLNYLLTLDAQNRLQIKSYSIRSKEVVRIQE